MKSQPGARAIVLLALVAGHAGLARVQAQDRDRPEAKLTADAAEAGNSPALREAVGALAGNQLYQTYLNIGFLADGRAEDLYSERDAQKILASVLALLDTLDRHLTRLTRLDLSKEDREGLEHIHKLSVLLRRQAQALRAFWKTGDREDGDRYEKLRKECWEGISGLLKLEDADDERVNLLREALQSKEVKVRIEAAQHLAKLGAAAGSAVPELIRALKDRTTGVRNAAAGALVEIGPEAVPGLVAALKEEDSSLRLMAAQVLGACGPRARQAAPALVVAVDDPKMSVRRAAIVALGQMGPDARDAIPVIEKCLREKDAVLRQLATAALKAIAADDDGKK